MAITLDAMIEALMTRRKKWMQKWLSENCLKIKQECEELHEKAPPTKQDLKGCMRTIGKEMRAAMGKVCFGLKEETLNNWFEQCVAQLYVARSAGVVYGVLTPNDIYICSDGTLYLRSPDTSLPQPNSLSRGFDTQQQFDWGMNTCRYMSPEFLTGLSYNGLSDFWSVGVIFLELSLGRCMFVDRPGDDLTKLVFDRIKSFKLTQMNNGPVEYSAEWVETLNGLLSQKPGDRIAACLTQDDNAENLLTRLRLPQHWTRPIPPPRALPRDFDDRIFPPAFQRLQTGLPPPRPQFLHSYRLQVLRPPRAPRRPRAQAQPVFRSYPLQAVEDEEEGEGGDGDSSSQALPSTQHNTVGVDQLVASLVSNLFSLDEDDVVSDAMSVDEGEKKVVSHAISEDEQEEVISHAIIVHGEGKMVVSHAIVVDEDDEEDEEEAV